MAYLPSRTVVHILYVYNGIGGIRITETAGVVNHQHSVVDRWDTTRKLMQSDR